MEAVNLVSAQRTYLGFPELARLRVISQPVRIPLSVPENYTRILLC
jgi:hypothetical protein